MGCVQSQPKPSSGAQNGQAQNFVQPDNVVLDVDDSRPLPKKPGESDTQKAATVVKALYDYEGRQEDDLSFLKDDKMEIIGERNSDDWWFAKHLVTGESGYIPSNFVAKDDNNPENQEWWFEIDRRESNKLLMLPGNPKGTFLVRVSSDAKKHALSVRDVEFGDVATKHYRIQKNEEGEFYISKNKAFPSIIDLVEFYKSPVAEGLCCQLTKPCPKEPVAVPFKDIEVERSKVVLLKKLGAGQFGEVWAGKWNGKVDCAVKTLKEGRMSIDAFLEEAKIMHRLRHRKLVQLMGVCTQDEPIYIITELMVNGALLDYLREDAGKTIKLKDMIDMAAQIADGMAYLENEAFIHRDLRAANILVGENNNCKVADFGLARVTNEEVYNASTQTKFPIKWTAPEAAYDRKFSIKSDVWSFGVLIYEIITFGRNPYPGMHGGEVLAQLEQGYRMPQPDAYRYNCPDSLYEMMRKCWHILPDERPTFNYLYNFFDDYFVATEPNYDEQ